MINNSFKTLLALSFFFIATSCSKQTQELPAEEEAPKNIILLIGDGMGLSQVSTAFFYQSINTS